VTDDATAPPEGQGRSYHRVAWARDGSLAFSAVVRSGDDARSELFVRQALDQPSRLVARDDEHFVIYLYPSPTPCSGRSGCPSLAYLIEEENGVGLHMVTAEDTATQDTLVAVGRPFYLSWSLDGREILWHTGGARRYNPAGEIGLYRIQEDRRSTLPYAPGAFLAPAWSPQGEGWLAVVESNGVDHLQHITPDEVTTLATTARRGFAFVWSPDGRQVAYAARKSDGTSSYGPVQVIDLRTGNTRQLTDDAFSILGFFWSPDGRRLAYVSRLDLPDAVWLQWRVFDLTDDLDRGFAAFNPSPRMHVMIHSFDQYAQSHRFWSPNGRYLVYADRDDQRQDRIWLVDTEAQKGADPILIDEGSIGVWSWR
jgi:TolB protein